jgi:hypothetical protein
MERLTGNKDADRKILEILNDKDLFESMLVNKYIYSLIDENFWRNRMISNFPSTFEFKSENETWKNYYLKVVYYIDKLKRDFKFNFIKGDPKKYYELISSNKKGEYPLDRKKDSELLKEGREDLVFYFINDLRRQYEMIPFEKGKKWENYKKKLLLEYP